MRDLVLEYIDSRWQLGYEYEFETTQIDVHLMRIENSWTFIQNW